MPLRAPGAAPGPMANPVQRVEAPLQLVLDRLFATPPRTPPPADRQAQAEGVRRALCATAVVITTADAHDGHTAEHVSPLTASLARTRRHPGHRSFGVAVAEGGARATIAIELDERTGAAGHDRFAVLVATGVPEAVADIGEPLCHTVRAFCRAGGRPLAELAVLNELRRWCGALPRGIEERCFAVFGATLDRVHMIFEPVIALGRRPSHLRVRSWEALARLEPGDARAPQELFTTAERWGSRFGVELDARLADRALHGFVAAHRASPYRVLQPLPVSINVSLRSVWSRTYERRLAASLRSCGLCASGVTLELSEKEPLNVPWPLSPDDAGPQHGEPHPADAHHPPAHTDWYGTDGYGASGYGASGYGAGDVGIADVGIADVAAFRHRLDHLRRHLGVGFAIDDLGSGYATFERMMQLSELGVKLSRSVLHQHAPLTAITSVLELAAQARRPHEVIVEGVDDLCPVSLASLYRIGVRNIQGHLTGTGDGELREIAEPTRQRLAALLAEAA